jgi:glycosyltransferase involved in cell wall biosynthesis
VDLIVVSHTYVEPENRGKLRALAAYGPVTAVVPRRWRESALGRSWTLEPETREGSLRVVAVRWWGRTHPSFGALIVPAGVSRDPETVVQIEEEPWTPTAYLATRRGGRRGRTVLFTWENLRRPLPAPWAWMRHAVLRRIAGLIAGSKGAAQVARESGYHGPLAVIPQLGVELPPADSHAVPSSGDALRLVFVGRLVREKGVDLLLQAASRLEAPWRLDLIGDGPERRRLAGLARDLGIGDRVTFRGARQHAEVAAAWPGADVCVLPSRSSRTWAEQFGHVLIEAMAYGVTVVGSTCGAIPDVIGDAGLVFPENDTGALAASLTRLARSPDHRRGLGAQGRRRVAEWFTNQRIAQRTRDFHQKIWETRSWELGTDDRSAL